MYNYARDVYIRVGSDGTSGCIFSSMGAASSCTEQVVFSENRL
jgi:hypothetical protein